MARGGKRPGAGKPKGHKASHTLEASKAREYVINRVVAELDPIVTGQIELAKGIFLAEMDIEGNIQRIYRKAPDLRAGEYLTDQTIGKPSQSVDLTSKGEKLDNSSEVKELAKKFDEFTKSNNSR